MSKYYITKPLNENMITQINGLVSKEKNTIIVFQNTKDINPKLLSKLDKKITISVTGGLDPRKRKFDNEKYQRRTYYNPSELIQIINKFEKIERKINPSWSEMEKAMYVYKTICEFSDYGETEYNGKSAARNLLGMITGKSVCSGYALIFKEAMDRIGIKCHYQNREGHHSWNILEINGNFYPVELTWDTASKKGKTCGFKYFCTEDDEPFYTSHHNIDDEPEETKYNLTSISQNELSRMKQNIESNRTMSIYAKDNTRMRINGAEVIIRNGIPYIEGNPLNFYRKSGNAFTLIKTGVKQNSVYEYDYITYEQNEQAIKIFKIYSENDFKASSIEYRDLIANRLLSEERVNRKINEFNGYVGYIGANRTMYYDKAYEEGVLHKFR